MGEAKRRQKWLETATEADVMEHINRRLTAAARAEFNRLCLKTGDPEVARLIMTAATYELSEGTAYPEQHEQETDRAYWTRVVQTLAAGFEERLSLENDTSDAAAKRRSELPFQALKLTLGPGWDQPGTPL